MREALLCGYHIDDYRQMFGLVDADFNASLLEYCSGVTAVNAELHARHQSMTSCDPWFANDLTHLEQLAHSNFKAAVHALQQRSPQSNSSHQTALAALIDTRRKGIEAGLNDYESGRSQKRYLPLENHRLPFDDFMFDIALCANWFFSDIKQQDVEFHVDSIRELVRVAKEVRIFPLVGENGEPSSLLGPTLLKLQQANFGVEIRKVDVHAPMNGDAMLRVWAIECQV
jgi:hypothetical protein